MPRSAQNKTIATKASPSAFINAIDDKDKRQACRTLVKLMKTVTGKPPKMWGASIVGFGQYHYRYESGREGDFFLTGFSPRKQNLSIYIVTGFSSYSPLMKKLGRYKLGKSCLYIKTLDDIDVGVLSTLIEKSVADLRKRYPE